MGILLKYRFCFCGSDMRPETLLFYKFLVKSSFFLIYLLSFFHLELKTLLILISNLQKNCKNSTRNAIYFYPNSNLMIAYFFSILFIILYLHTYIIYYFVSELLGSKLVTSCSSTSKFFSVYFLREIIFFYIYQNQEI